MFHHCKFTLWKISSFCDFKMNPLSQSSLRIHHHHHVAPTARLSLTLSRHPSLSSIIPDRSSSLHLISAQNCCIGQSWILLFTLFLSLKLNYLLPLKSKLSWSSVIKKKRSLSSVLITSFFLFFIFSIFLSNSFQWPQVAHVSFIYHSLSLTSKRSLDIAMRTIIYLLIWKYKKIYQ